MAKKKTNPSKRQHTVALNKEGVASSRALPKVADLSPPPPVFAPAPPVPRLEPGERIEPRWQHEDEPALAARLQRLAQALDEPAMPLPVRTVAAGLLETPAVDAAPPAAPVPAPSPAPVAVRLPPPGEQVLARLTDLRATNAALAASLARLNHMHASPDGTDQEQMP